MFEAIENESQQANSMTTTWNRSIIYLSLTQ